jgi:hypothetical protein
MANLMDRDERFVGSTTADMNDARDRRHALAEAAENEDPVAVTSS